MRIRIILITALAVSLAAIPSLATPLSAGAASVSLLALPVAGVSGIANDVAVHATGALGGGDARYRDVERTRYESIRYRPRRHRDTENWGSGYRGGGHAQVHGGFFDPEGDAANGALFGLRFGSSIEDRVQLGVGFDWSHRSDRQTQVLGSAPLPGGGTVERRVELARSSSDLLPMLGFIQVSPVGDSPVSPYFGIGGGYEVLFVSAEDFGTGAEYDATFDGWGWQAWAGVAFPFAERSRLNLEVFTNSGELNHDLDDDSSGLTFREIVNVDGVGLRGGLSWVF